MSSAYYVTKGLRGRYLVIFRCPKCGRHLRFPITSAGKVETCSRCKGLVAVPGEAERRLVIQNELVATKKKKRQCASPSVSVEKCPFCGAAASPGIAKCAYCREYLDGRNAVINIGRQSPNFVSHPLIASFMLLFGKRTTRGT